MVMLLHPKQPLRTRKQFRRGFRQALDGMLFDDGHGHDMPLCMGPYAIQGLDEATAYHYNEGEYAQVEGVSPASMKVFRELHAQGRCDIIVDRLLRDAAPAISTAMNGIYRIAKSLGIPGNRPLKEIILDWRSQFGAGKMSREDYRDMLFKRSRVRSIVSTQSIFVPGEADLYLNDEVMAQWDKERYEIGVRCDELLRDPAAVALIAKRLDMEAAAGDPADAATQEAMRRLVRHFIERFRKAGRVRYLSLSMGAEDLFYDANGAPAQSRFAIIMREVILKLAREEALPVFVMPYVKRKLNALAGPTGDVVSHGNVDDLKLFMAANADIKFIVTGLHPSLNYDFCFTARALSNVRVAGFWWGNLNSGFVRRQIQARFEMLGLGWTGLNSDERVTDQLLYKWDDYLDDLEWVLVNRRFPAMVRADNPVTVEGMVQILNYTQSTEYLFRLPKAAAA